MLGVLLHSIIVYRFFRALTSIFSFLLISWSRCLICPTPMAIILRGWVSQRFYNFFILCSILLLDYSYPYWGYCLIRWLDYFHIFLTLALFLRVFS
jgi:hypothetical protein